MAADFKHFGLFHRKDSLVKERCLLQRVLSKLKKSGVIFSVNKRFPCPTTLFTLHCVDYFPCYLGCNYYFIIFYLSILNSTQYIQYKQARSKCSMGEPKVGDPQSHSIHQWHHYGTFGKPLVCVVDHATELTMEQQLLLLWRISNDKRYVHFTIPSLLCDCRLVASSYDKSWSGPTSGTQPPQEGPQSAFSRPLQPSGLRFAAAAAHCSSRSLSG